MPTLQTKRRCPYCGSSIQLGDCTIVATGFDSEYLSSEDFDVAEIELPSGTVPTDFLPKTKWPVIAPAAKSARVLEPAGGVPEGGSKVERLFRRPEEPMVEEDAELPPLLSAGVLREDLPARACPRCQFPLPQSIDFRPAVVVGIVGVNRVGKTHLLAAIMTEAYRRRGLASIGCTEFVPDENTSSRFTEDYFLPLFRRQEILDATNPEDEEVRFRPLVFDVTLPDTPPFTLVLHDVAGEVFGSQRKREHLAAYLKAARGLIFVVDPRDIDDLRDRLEDWIVESNELGSWDQGALLAACVKPGGILDRSVIPPGASKAPTPPPVAVTISKADLLPRACPQRMDFLVPAPPEESRAAFEERVRRSSAEVEAFLERHRAYNILGPARDYQARMKASPDPAAGRVTYHAVSALGATPDEDEQLADRVRPLNCLDPLATVLLQIAGS
jgi:hypothetical protein